MATTPAHTMPPHSQEAEECVLGSIIASSDLVYDVVDKLEPKDFYLEPHQAVYRAVRELADEGIPLGEASVADRLQHNGDYQYAGGGAVLRDLMAKGTADPEYLEYNVKVIRSHSQRRQLIKSGSDIATLGFDPTSEIHDVLEKAEQTILSVSQRSSQRDYVTMPEAVAHYAEVFQQLINNGGKPSGVPTGLHDLDTLTGGLQKTNLIIIAGRPGLGKSSLILSMMLNMARAGKRVGFFSFEMSEEEVVQKLASMISGVSTTDIRHGCVRGGVIDEDMIDRVMNALDQLQHMPITIQEGGDVSIQQTKSQVRRMKAVLDLDIVFIDYLQLMRSASKNESRVSEVSEISRSLKLLAKELDIPIVALCQLNRQVESRADKHPMISDLRESGALEQDADIVMLLYRDEMYNPDSERKGIAELNVAKHRHGPTQVCELFYNNHTTQFASMVKAQYAGVEL